VALARALAREPAVLLLDEPFAAVDRRVRRRLQDEISALRRMLDIPLLLVTHDFDDVVRLATDLLILDRGRAVAYGPLQTLASRPDLTWLREAVGLGSVFDATVSQVLESRALVELTFDGGTLLAPGRSVDVGSRVRVRIPAREVILATRAPDGLSLHNMLAGTVSAIDGAAGSDQAMVQVAIGGTLLLAEVTRDAVTGLRLAVGAPIHALIKSVSVEVIAREAGSGSSVAGSR
jgi:molybdate transport system ATP-binding protein